LVPKCIPTPVADRHGRINELRTVWLCFCRNKTQREIHFKQRATSGISEGLRGINPIVTADVGILREVLSHVGGVVPSLICSRQATVVKIVQPIKLLGSYCPIPIHIVHKRLIEPPGVYEVAGWVLVGPVHSLLSSCAVIDESGNICAIGKIQTLNARIRSVDHVN